MPINNSDGDWVWDLCAGNGPNRYQYPLRSPLEHVGSLPETFIPSPAVMAGSDDVGTAKNEAELSYNDPNVTLPTLDTRY